MAKVMTIETKMHDECTPGSEAEQVYCAAKAFDGWDLASVFVTLDPPLRTVYYWEKDGIYSL